MLDAQLWAAPLAGLMRAHTHRRAHPGGLPGFHLAPPPPLCSLAAGAVCAYSLSLGSSAAAEAC